MNWLTNIIQEIFIINIKTSLNTSLLISIVLVVTKILKNTISIKFKYTLWILIILRILIPHTFYINMDMYNPISNIVTVSQENILEYTKNASSIQSDKKNLRTANESNISKENKLILRVGLLIWLLGCFITLIYIIYNNFKFYRSIGKAKLVDDTEILKLFSECKTQMFINRKIKLVVSNNIRTPLLYGVIKPTVVIPEETLNTMSLDEVKYILLHELAHFKRKDLFFYLLLSVLSIFYWYNPVIIYGFNKIKEDCEICCDFYALKFISKDEVINYGYTLIKVVEKISRKRKPSLVMTIVNNKSQLKRRIKMISKFKTKSNKISILGVFILACIGFMIFTNSNVVGKNIEDKKVIIYNTHSFEDYNYGDSVVDVSNKINKNLIDSGIKSEVVSIPVTNKKQEAYDDSRNILKSKNKELNNSILLDIHRDIDSDGEDKLIIVLGKKNPNFKENLKFANSLLNEMNKLGESNVRIIELEGKYNQDLSSKSILIELGNNKSSKETIDNYINILTKALSNMNN